MLPGMTLCTCPLCHASHYVPTELVGTEVACLRCHGVFKAVVTNISGLEARQAVPPSGLAMQLADRSFPHTFAAGWIDPDRGVDPDVLRADRVRRVRRNAALAVVLSVAVCAPFAVRVWRGPGLPRPVRGGAKRGELEPPAAVRPDAGRYALATMQVSRVGDFQADVTKVIVGPDGALVVAVRIRGMPPSADWPAGWAAEAGALPRLAAESSGRECRRLAADKVAGVEPPSPDGCGLAFEVTPGERGAYLLDLPFEVGGVKSAFRFRVPFSVQGSPAEGASPRPAEPFARAMPPADAELSAAAEPLRAMRSGTVAGSPRVPVPAGRFPRHVELYEEVSAVSPEAAARLVADGDVVIFAEPTAVAVEGRPAASFVWVRAAAGPGKGQLLAVRVRDLGPPAK